MKEEFELMDLFSLLIAKKWLIICITSIFALFSVFYSLSLPNIYKAEALLAPNGADYQSNNLVNSSFGGLANLAGINLNSNQGNKLEIGLEVLTSRKFVKVFIEKRNLLPFLLAVESWKIESDTPNFNKDLYDDTKKEWLIDEIKGVPILEQAQRNFSQNFSVGELKQSSLLTFSFSSISPSLSKQIIDWLIIDINEEIRNMDQKESESLLALLEQQVASTTNVELKSLFYSLMQEETKKIMLTKVRSEYFLKTIDPAIIPLEKIAPKRSVICITYTFFGFVLSVAIVFLLTFLRKK